MESEEKSDTAKIVLIKDLEDYYIRKQKEGSDIVSVRVLGKVLKLIPKKTICDFIKNRPDSTRREFWETMVNGTDKKVEFDDIYGIILHKNELFIIEAEPILLQYRIKEGSVYFFTGQLEETMFSYWRQVILKPKIALNADNLNLHLFDEVVSRFSKLN